MVTDIFEMFDEAQDVLDGAAEVSLDAIIGEVQALVAKHAPHCGNEVLAAIAREAFLDSCEASRVPNASHAFAEAFPTLALYAEGF